MNIRGKYRWMASRKDLRLFSPGMSATFTVPRATTLWNHRAVRPPDIGRFPSPVAWIELSRPPGSIQQPHQRDKIAHDGQDMVRLGARPDRRCNPSFVAE